jgi:hypothetical protein
LDLDSIVAQLEEERDRLNEAIGALKGLGLSANRRKIAAADGKRSSSRRGSRLSAAGRRRLSELMKKRWAERKRKAKSS